MPISLKPIDIQTRIKNYPGDNYLFIGGLFKSMALGAACYSGINIMINIHLYWPSIYPWFASFAAMMVSYVTWGRGILLTNSRSNLLDSILPFLMGWIEVGLFIVLYHEDNQVYTEMHQFWMLLFALHSLIAFILVTNRICNTKINDDFHPSLIELASKYVGWMKSDCKGTLCSFLFAFLLWIFIYYDIWPFENCNDDFIQSAFAIISVIILSIVIIIAEAQRKQIIKAIDEIQR